jgi:hypothetical protein
MDLGKFCSNRYQELNLYRRTDPEAEFDFIADSESKAAYAILNAYRNVLKWALMPKCLIDWLLVQLELKDEPRAVLVDQLKEMRDRRSQA